MEYGAYVRRNARRAAFEESIMGVPDIRVEEPKKLLNAGQGLFPLDVRDVFMRIS